jgi:hypothetical protein
MDATGAPLTPTGISPLIALFPPATRIPPFFPPSPVVCADRPGSVLSPVSPSACAPDPLSRRIVPSTWVPSTCPYFHPPYPISVSLSYNKDDFHSDSGTATHPGPSKPITGAWQVRGLLPCDSLG